MNKENESIVEMHVNPQIKIPCIHDDQKECINWGDACEPQILKTLYP